MNSSQGSFSGSLFYRTDYSYNQMFFLSDSLVYSQLGSEAMPCSIAESPSDEFRARTALPGKNLHFV